MGHNGNFVVSSGKITYHTTHTFLKRFRDSPAQAGSLPNTVVVAKIGHYSLVDMTIIHLKHLKCHLPKYHLYIHMLHLSHTKGREYTYHIKHFVFISTQ